MVVVADTGFDTARELDVLASMVKMVDGVAVVAANSDEIELPPDLQPPFPLVWLHDRRDGQSAPSIAVDHLSAGALATEHMILHHGHRRVNFIGLTDKRGAVADRRRGWASLVGAKRADELFVDAVAGPSGGAVALRRLIAGRIRPTAVVVGTFGLALGVLREAADQRLRVPEDLAVITFDGSAQGDYTVPRLSAVTQPLDEMIASAVQFLVRDDPPRDATAITFTSNLHPSESCGCGQLSNSFRGAEGN